MDIIEAGNKVIQALDYWSKSKEKLVVGIDGITGVGKTTLAEYVTKNSSKVLLIHIDDFMTPLDFRTAEVKKLNDPTNFFIHNWFEYEDIRKLVKEFRSGRNQKFKTKAYHRGKRSVLIEYDLSKSILIIEGVLLFHPELIDDIWDMRIFLDGDEKHIKERRVSREKQRWGEKYISENDPISWSGFILKGLKQYQRIYNPRGKADLVLIITPD